MVGEPQPITKSKHIFACIYGPPSSGKTRLICSLADSLIIRPPVEHTESVKDPALNVRELVVGNWTDMNDALDYLRHEGHKHSFVWLDSLSGWQDVGLDDVWADTIAARPHRKGTPIDKGEYNQNFVRIAQWIRAAVGVDAFNFGWTAWPEELEDPEGKTKLMPWVQGRNMANRMTGYMKLVAYLERKPNSKGEMVRVLRIGEHKDYFTKDQYGLPDKILNPTMPKLMEAIAATQPKATARTGKTKSTTRRKRTIKKGS